MDCTSPLKAYKAHGGGIVFSPVDGFYDKHLEVACGQCMSCRINKSRDWSVRLTHENLYHTQSSFLTLTYDEEHLPENGSLDISHWQLFAKRLRQTTGSFRFYHCGEYGAQTNRAHLHAIIFGHNFNRDRELYKHSRKEKLYESESLNETWSHGQVLIGDVTPQSCAYVAGYIQEKLHGQAAHRIYGDRKHPYSTMSRNPGLGSKYLTRSNAKNILINNRVLLNYQPQPIPDYYLSQIEKKFAADPELLDLVEKIRNDKKQHKDPLGTTPERLRAKAEVRKARAEVFARDPER